MKLYVVHGSTNSRKVVATAHHLGTTAEIVALDFAKGDLQTPEYEAINPNKKVPALADDDFTLFESTVIMLYLADVAGDTIFLPSDRRRRSEIIQWMCWDECHFGRWAATVAYERMIKPTFGMGKPNETIVEEALAFFHRFAAILDARLADREFVMGDDLTVADFALAAQLTYAEPARIPILGYPAIVRWRSGLDALPAWAASAPRSQ